MLPEDMEDLDTRLRYAVWALEEDAKRAKKFIETYESLRQNGW